MDNEAPVHPICSLDTRMGVIPKSLSVVYLYKGTSQNRLPKSPGLVIRDAESVSEAFVELDSALSQTHNTIHFICTYITQLSL